MNATLVLEEGTILQGDSFGAAAAVSAIQAMIKNELRYRSLQENRAIKPLLDFMFIDWSKNGFSQH